MAGLVVDNLFAQSKTNDVIDSWQGDRRLGGIRSDNNFDLSFSRRLKCSHLLFKGYVGVNGKACVDDSWLIDRFNHITEGFDIIHSSNKD